MKNAAFVLILVFCCADYTVAQVPQWEYVEAAPTVSRAGRHDDIRFLDPSTAWMVNTRGELWHTADGAESWERQWYDPALALRSVVFVDDQRGWMGTVNSSFQPLMETKNGGRTWQLSNSKISGPRPAGICGLYATDENHIFGVGAYFGAPSFIRTEDGGDSWTSLDMSPYASSLVDVHFFSSEIGIATGGTGSDLDGEAVVLRTTDSGRTWERVHVTTRKSGIAGEWGWKITFPTEKVGYISIETLTNDNGHPAKVLKTEDGGLTWRDMNVDGSVSRAGLQGIGFISEDVGWASGRGVTSLTQDGGDTWVQLPDYNPSNGTGQLDGRINRFFPVNDTLSYAIGNRVYRLRHDAVPTSVETIDPLPDIFELESAYPNPFRESTTLSFSLSEPALVRAFIIDVTGRIHRNLVYREFGTGRHSLIWDGRDNAGMPVGSGSYIVLWDIGEAAEMKLVVRVK